MIGKSIVFATMLACTQAASVHAQEPDLVRKLYDSVVSSPRHVVIKKGHYKLEVARQDTSRMTLIAQAFADGRQALGVFADYEVTAKESNYSLDTPCEVGLASSKADGVADLLIKWDCIAYTPKMEGFVGDMKNRQRVFDRLVSEAVSLSGPR